MPAKHATFQIATRELESSPDSQRSFLSALPKPISSAIIAEPFRLRLDRRNEGRRHKGRAVSGDRVDQRRRGYDSGENIDSSVGTSKDDLMCCT